MNTLRGFLLIMGVLAVLALIALVVGYVLALLTPDIRSNMRPVVLSSEAADSLTSKLDNLKKETAIAYTGKTPEDIELIITEEEINSMIVMGMAEGNIPAKEMLVNLNDGYALIYNAWNFPWLPVKTALMGSLDAENGKPLITIRDFFLGKLPLPSGVKNTVQDLVTIMAKLNTYLDDLSLDLKEITISEGQVKLIVATRSPK